MRNVEIKAGIKNVNALISKVRSLSDNDGKIIKQHDTFFKVPQGRFKLRKFEEGNAELIYYERPDTEGPKVSSYEKANISGEAVNDLSSILEKALGMQNVVKKVRHLFLVGQTRIHVDSVEGLGDFMELEVVLNDDQTLKDGENIALDLMKKLDVNKEDLISGAYADLLNK
ncbi:hypothetical protein NQ318_003653 [Aromia moschata]|uniref:CYTH domain-containing protein n=1 Tax=Aromia moschata TaxID=1265417 RepID=A0AAV8Y3J9_9CUCU|nr:hypothetical protein NQ318_003653 [Aromia moschata]